MKDSCSVQERRRSRETFGNRRKLGFWCSPQQSNDESMCGGWQDKKGAGGLGRQSMLQKRLLNFQESQYGHGAYNPVWQVSINSRPVLTPYWRQLELRGVGLPSGRIDKISTLWSPVHTLQPQEVRRSYDSENEGHFHHTLTS